MRAQAKGLADAFYFSVQTFATIGYGHMFPACHSADIIVVIETIFSVLFMSILTGMIFSRFARAPSRVVFSSECLAESATRFSSRCVFDLIACVDAAYRQACNHQWGRTSGVPLSP